MQHLILNLEAPIMAFGGEMIDNLGVTRWFPSASMLTGLLASSLGWRRTDRGMHQRLQDRLVFAARIDREPQGGVRLRDFQTAQLGGRDRGWTTRGRPEGRSGGANTYLAPHLRYRDYFADMRVTVAMRLQPEDESPDLVGLGSALDQPARPLFIGRKPCLPSVPLLVGTIEAETALAALIDTAVEAGTYAHASVRLQWPDGEGVPDIRPANTAMITDQRNWVSGLHGGGRLVCEGSLSIDSFPVAGATSEEGE